MDKTGELGGEAAPAIEPRPAGEGVSLTGAEVVPLSDEQIQAAREKAGIGPQYVGNRSTTNMFDLSTASMSHGRKRGALPTR